MAQGWLFLSRLNLLHALAPSYFHTTQACLQSWLKSLSKEE